MRGSAQPRCRPAFRDVAALFVALGVPIAGSIACAQVAAAHPALPSPTADPVRIVRCAIEDRPVFLDLFSGMRVNLVSGIALRFVNDRDAAATRVTVALHYQGVAESVVESGTFELGSAVDEHVTAFTGMLYAADTADCRVTSAAFADGSSWSAGPTPSRSSPPKS